MKTLFTTIFLFWTITSFSQSYSGNFTFRSTLYTIQSERQESGAFKIIIEENDENKSDFTIKPLKLETFDVAFKSKLSSISTGTPFSSAEITELTSIAKSLFFNIVAESLNESLSDAPVAGVLKISKTVYLYEKKDQNQKASSLSGTETIVISDIEIEFYEGYIETIKVNGVGGGKNYRFENQLGTGFSARSNYSRLNNVRLFDFKEGKFILLGELLDYDYKVKPQTRDFSPGNQVLYSYGGQKVELRKEETSKLIEAIVYSDFIGIDKDKPNGLIQIECAKRLNLNPNRLQAHSRIEWLFTGFGFFQFIRPAVTISKIEQNNRFLHATTNDSIYEKYEGSDTSYTLKTQLVSTPIEVSNYQNLSLGLDLNILFLDNPDMKFNFFLNGGFRYGRTAIRDSLRTLNTQNIIENTGLTNEYGVNYFTFYPEAVLQFLPEERFSFSILYRLQYFSSAFTEPVLISYNKEGEFESKTSKLISTFEIMAYVKTGENGKIFGRWRFNGQWTNVNENYQQIQVGYSFYILKKN